MSHFKSHIPNVPLLWHRLIRFCLNTRWFYFNFAVPILRFTINNFYLMCWPRLDSDILLFESHFVGPCTGNICFGKFCLQLRSESIPKKPRNLSYLHYAADPYLPSVWGKLWNTKKPGDRYNLKKHQTAGTSALHRNLMIFWSKNCLIEEILYCLGKSDRWPQAHKHTWQERSYELIFFTNCVS